MRVNTLKSLGNVVLATSLTYVVMTCYSLAISSEKQFIIDYDTTYDIQETGETWVKQRATLTNLKNDIVPTGYSFTIRNFTISDLTAETNGKSSTPTVETDKGETTVKVNIKSQVIGKDNQNTIIINYKTKNMAVKTGAIWNIFIPKIQIPDTTNIYNVKVYVPKYFGPKIYFSPSPILEKSEDTRNVYNLNKDSFKTGGLNAAFGTEQVVNFKIKYELANPTILIISKDIALPPDVDNYQKVAYTALNPKPTTIFIDQDGNAIARYMLLPKARFDVFLDGSAKILTRQINLDLGKSLADLDNSLITKYTGSKQYWETTALQIKALVKKLKNPNFNTIRNAQISFNYVVDNLSYDFDAINKNFVERKGALTALTQKGYWTCMEFADTFITLARATGIPAREIDGYAFNYTSDYTPISVDFQKADLLHAWAEFYDPFYGWIQVDPTWATTSGIDYFTKTDTNRLILVRRGLSSEKPGPAGSYRLGDDHKLIDVDYSLSDNSALFTPTSTHKKLFSLNLWEMIKGNSLYRITNTGNVFVTLNGITIAPRIEKNIFLPKGFTFP
jgi:transglutaminase-like putative cysteine protease